MNNRFLLVIASLLCMIAGSSLAEDADRGQLTRDQLFSTANSPDSPVASMKPNALPRFAPNCLTRNDGRPICQRDGIAKSSSRRVVSRRAEP